MKTTEEHLGDEYKKVSYKLREAEAALEAMRIRLEEQDELIRDLKFRLGMVRVKIEGYVS